MFLLQRTSAAILLLVFVLAGCATPAVDYRSGTDFRQYDTVSLHFPGAPPLSLDEARAESVLRELFPDVGLNVVDEGGDLIANLNFIPYHWYDTDELFWRYDMWREPWGVGLRSPIIVHEREAVKMELELIDRARNTVVWRAVSAGGMESWLAGPAREEWIRENLDRMLDSWPPMSE